MNKFKKGLIIAILIPFITGAIGASAYCLKQSVKVETIFESLARIENKVDTMYNYLLEQKKGD